MKKPESLEPLVQKLESLEHNFETIESLLANGIIFKGDTIQAGDWELCNWTHSFDGCFSVGAINRVRLNNDPFPVHVHEQKLWILCSKGNLTIKFKNGGPDVVLSEGQYRVIADCLSHSISANTNECVAVLVTIPSDPGF